MANYPQYNLTGKKINATYTNLSQLVSGSIVVDGGGNSVVDLTKFTSSYAYTSSYISSINSAYTSSITNNIIGLSVNNFFEKDIQNQVAFTVLNSQSLSISCNLLVFINNTASVFISGSFITMPTTLLAGNDYGIYATNDNKLIATYVNTGSNPYDGYTNPSGYNNTNSRLIGGFYFAHSGSTPLPILGRSRSNNIVTLSSSLSNPGFITGDTIDVTLMTDLTYNSTDVVVTVNGSNISFVNSGSDESYISDTAGRLWKTNNTGFINQYSLWDLKFRPETDPRGMVLINNKFWSDIWLTNVNYLTCGTSRKGQRIAGGESATSKPYISTKMGGNGVTKYSDCSWFTANEVVKHWGKRLLSHTDYSIATYGTNEASSFGTDAQYTCRCSNYTSKWGLEQASGVMYIWGSDYNWQFLNDTNLSSTGRSRSGNVATVTCSVAHGLLVGDSVTLTSFGGTGYNRNLTTVISTPSATTFTYNAVGSDESPTSDTTGKIGIGIPQFNYFNVNGSRGQLYIQGSLGLITILLGGSWFSGAYAGSRRSDWSSYPWLSYSGVGVRAACGHIVVP